MQVYALTSSHLLHETLDLLVTREDAEAELREGLLEGKTSVEAAGWSV